MYGSTDRSEDIAGRSDSRVISGAHRSVVRVIGVPIWQMKLS